MTSRGFVVRVIGSVWIVIACGAHSGPPVAPGGAGDAVAVSEVGAAPEAAITLQLSEGAAGPAAVDHAILAPATPLADADAAAIWRGAAPPAVDASDAPVVLQHGPPPPAARPVFHAAFPPVAAASGALPRASSELAVVRHAPDGKVSLAAELSVTFNQPMVALSGHDDAA